MSVEPSEAAQAARERLQEEIERVRLGVEEMLVDPAGESEDSLRAELDQLRLETRDYVKRRVRKSEKRLQRTVTEVAARSDLIEERLGRVESNRAAAEARIDELEADQAVAEARIDQVEADRAEAETRIHEDTEGMLDGLLDEVRTIADRLAKMPAPAAAPAPRRLPAPVQAPVGRIGQQPPVRRAV